MNLRLACVLLLATFAICGCDPGSSSQSSSNSAPANNSGSSATPGSATPGSTTPAPAQPVDSSAPPPSAESAPEKAAVPSISIVSLKLPADAARDLPVSVRAKIQDVFATLEENPFDDQALAVLAALYWVHASPELSVKALDQAAKISPKQFRWPYLKSFAYEKAKNFKAAADECTKAHELDPKFTRALQRRAQLLLQVDPKQAMDALKAALDADPRDALSMLALGQCHEKLGDNAAAIEWVRKAIATYPDFAIAHATLSSLLEKTGDAAGAKLEARLAELSGAYPIQDFVQWEAMVVGLDLGELIRTAVLQAERRNFAEADQMIMTAMQLDPSGVAARRALATVRLYQGKPDQAIGTLTRILEENPDDVQTRAQYAEILSREKRYDEALTEFRKVQEKRPTDIRVKMAIAQTLARLGKEDEAVSAYKELISVAPEFDGPYLALSDIARAKKNDAELERLLRDCLTHAPGSVVALNSLAWYLAANHDPAKRKPDEAIALATRACDLTRYEQHELIDTLAVAQASGGKFDDAIKNVEKAVALAEREKNDALTREYRSRLEQFKQKRPYSD